MPDPNTIMTEGLRLTVLRLVAGAAGRTANEHVLHMTVESFGFRVARDRIRVELAWLRDQGLLSVTELKRDGGPPLMVAIANARTLDVVEDRATVPGVARPSPRS
ncbi:ArsR family transcriptional regulator [Thalassobaculum sp.]|uniref:VpaChn25_0724 family phage protein n=1 Tax=Thalassobaculum sp. TaxID=2022740 RepID=UPI0032ED929A